MSFQAKYKKPIPTEKETRANILITAMSIGCKEQVINLFKFYDNQLLKEKTDPTVRLKIAKACILDLYKLDQRLVYHFLNDNGEVVVGNEVLIKLNNFKI